MAKLPLSIGSVFALALLCVFIANARADVTNSPAAEAWEELTSLTMPAPPAAWLTNAPTELQLAQFRQRQALQVGAAADKAREFYLQFPQDPNANLARLVEFRMLLLGTQLGATNRLADIDARERELLKISNLSEDQRFMLRVNIINRELNAAGSKRKALLEKSGRDLIREFPRQGEGYNVLLQLAHDSEPPKARELLKLILTTNAPYEIQASGESMLKQLEFIGKTPDIQFTAVDGRAVDLRQLKGKVVLLDFWATWCQPCLMTLPEVQAAYGRFHAKGLEIIGISLDDDKAKVEHFVASRNMPWPEYFDGQGGQSKFVKSFGVEAIPALWLVDKKGVVRDINGDAGLTAKAEKLLAE